MKPRLKRFHSPDLEDVEVSGPSNLGHFGVLVQLMIGPEGDGGDESFDIMVCSPSWLAERVKQGGLLDLRHHLLVDSWAWDRVADYLERFLATIDEPSWPQVAAIVGRLGKWEFEDYDGR